MKNLIGIKVISLALVFVFCAFTVFAGAQPVKKDVYNIAFINKAMGNSFYEALKDSVVDEFQKIAKENNVVINVTAQECQNNGEIQADYMRSARMRKVDAMIILTTDAYTAIPEVIEANKVNLPIFTVFDWILGGDITSNITYDYTESGRIAALFLVEKLTERYGKPQGNVVELLGILGSSTTTDKSKGFMEVIKQYPEIKIVAQQPFDFSAEKAITVFTNMLQSNPKIDGLFAHCDEGVQGAIAAMKSMNRFYPVGDPKHIISFGEDCPYIGLLQIRNLEQDASIDTGPTNVGRYGVRVAWDYLGNGIIPEKTITVSTKVIDSPEKTLDPTLWGNIYKY
jgi:ribose transport system substrate-binding protein